MAGAAQLSRRELELISRVALGLTYKEIAWELGLAPGTVKAYATKLYNKMQLPNAAAAAYWWAQHEQEYSDELQRIAARHTLRNSSRIA